MCVLQECPAGLLVLWRTACFRGQTSMLAALWSISVTLAFTCWETPKCTAPTVGSGEEIHQPVWVSHEITLGVFLVSDAWERKILHLCCLCVCVCVQMWMSVLWDLTVTNMRDVGTQRAPTPAHVPTRTVEMAKTAQVTRCN